MKCKVCTTEIKNQWKFCTKCGTAIPKCNIEGCEEPLTKSEHKYCLRHWRETQIMEGLSLRERLPAKHRTTDGHLVRSKAEIVIDNWLYNGDIAHAYERKLPIIEDIYCDFYIPRGNVYIEYWGIERDPKYMARRKNKQEIYERYKLNLIELTDEQIRNLDDHLPRLLLKFKIQIR